MLCTGSHGITVGSVWYDDVVNVTYRRVAMHKSGAGPRIKGRRVGNATLRDITFENISLHGVKTAIDINMEYETHPPSKTPGAGVRATRVRFVDVTGDASSRVASLSCGLRGCDEIEAVRVVVSAPKGWECDNASVAVATDDVPPPTPSCMAAPAGRTPRA